MNRGRIIQGDNLSVLKSLMPEIRGRVKCAYLDPPYNTGTHRRGYKDKFPREDWLSFMKDRLVLLKDTLTDDGTLWISISDHQCHYLKVMCDDIFKEKNFIGTVVWERKRGPTNSSRRISINHEHILVYARKIDNAAFNLFPRSKENLKTYQNRDNDPRGKWMAGCLLRPDFTKDRQYEITNPQGKKYTPPIGRSWRLSKEQFNEYLQDNRIWFGKNNDSGPAVKSFLNEQKDGIVSLSLWRSDEAGSSTKGFCEFKKALDGKKTFPTVKPEAFMERIFYLCTNEGDLILDPFAGSGTSGVVAHKMNRKYILIEKEETIHTHLIPRIEKTCFVENEAKNNCFEGDMPVS